MARLLAIATAAAPQLVGVGFTEATEGTLTDLLYDALQELSETTLRAKVADSATGVEEIGDEQDADLLN